MEGPPEAVAVDEQKIRSSNQEIAFAAVGGPSERIHFLLNCCPLESTSEGQPFVSEE